MLVLITSQFTQLQLFIMSSLFKKFLMYNDSSKAQSLGAIVSKQTQLIVLDHVEAKTLILDHPLCSELVLTL